MTRRDLMTPDELATMDGAYRVAYVEYVEQLTEVLCDNLVDLFDNLTGDRRTNRSAREARWRGNSGNQSVSVILHGRKRGVWFDHGSQKGGLPVQAIRHFLAYDFLSALDWAADRYGFPRWDAKAVRKDASEKIAKERAAREKKRAEKVAQAAAEDAKKLAADLRGVAAIVARTKPIAGTIGEAYLRFARRIEESRETVPDRPLPDSVRWSEADQALVFLVTDTKGVVVGVQFVAVTPDGKQDKARYGKAGAKISRGPINLGSVKFQGDPKGPILFAEGPETGLALWLATGFETRVVLGVSGFKRIVKEAPIGRKIILCRDDDATNKQSYKAAVAGLFMLANAGADVWDAFPFEERRQNGDDFNDLLIEGGPAAVEERIADALHDQRSIGRIEHNISRAEEMVDTRVGAFFQAARLHKEGEPQIAQALGVDTGVGKTEAAITHLVKHVARLRAAGDQRPVVMLVPEHRLSSEVSSRIRRAIEHAGEALKVEVWRGRGAPKPNAKNDADRMCDDLETVKEAEEVLANIEREVCAICPHGPKNAGDCRYLAQQGLDADVWVAAHNLMFRAPPKAMMRHGGIAALVVDEDMLGAGIRAPFELPIDALEAMALPKDEDGRLDLLDFRHRLAESLSRAEPGFLKREALNRLDLEISHAAAKHAIELEWSRKLDVKKEKDWRKREANRTLTKAVSLAKAVADLTRDDGPAASGLISVGVTREKVKVVRVSHRAQIHAAWVVPTLVMDAMHYDTAVLKHFWPTIEDLQRVNVATPHQKIYQVVDRSYSLSWLAPPKKKRRLKQEPAPTEEPADDEGKAVAALPQDARAAAAARNRRDVAASILRIHRERGARTLVIGNKEVVKALKFPAGAQIETAWFGAMAGRDQWKDVRTLIVLGRPLPRPGAMETMAATLTGEAVETLASDPENPRASWYRRERKHRERRQGRTVVKVPAEVDVHPDAMVERLRWQECVGAIMQAIGRGRGTRRTADTPLEVFVLTDVVLPVPVDQFLLSADIEPTLADLQIAAGGVAFESGSCAAAAYPEIWSSSDAFRSDLKREKEASRQIGEFEKAPCHSPINIYYTSLTRSFSETANLPKVEFQLSGNGQNRQAASYDPEICPDPRAFIEAKVGAPAWFSITSPHEDEGAERLAAPAVAGSLALAVDTGRDPPPTGPRGGASQPPPAQPPDADRPAAGAEAAPNDNPPPSAARCIWIAMRFRDRAAKLEEETAAAGGPNVVPLRPPALLRRADKYRRLAINLMLTAERLADEAGVPVKGRASPVE